jgi:heat shock protein HtpX
MRRDIVLLQVRLVAVTVGLVALGTASLAVVASALFVYYLLLVGTVVVTAGVAVALVVVTLPVGALSGTVVVPVILWSTVALAGVSTVARLGLLVGPGVLRELRGDGAVLDGLATRPVDAATYPRLDATVRRVAQQFDLPVPRIRVVDSDAPIAISVGYRPATSTVVVSTGLVGALDATELEAVLAHELAHVRNRDAAVMTAATLPLGFARNAVEEGRQIDWEEVEEDLEGGIDPSDLWKASFALYLVLYPVALGGRILAAALARGRETVADRAAATATGSPAALASALATLDERVAAVPESDLRRGSAAATLSILPPAEHERPGYFPWIRRWLLRNVYHTHPPTERRIERLRTIAAAAETA